ncbi:MAG: hypothetical protein J5944_09385 [Lentisphaeria bacterium]|nr:hypothetical protein [Lentisphaeria bacterium]
MYSFLLELFCFLQLAAPFSSLPEFPKAVHSPDEAVFIQTESGPARDIADLLEMIRFTSPGLYQRICKMPRKVLLEAFLSAADSCVSAEPEADTQASSADRKINVFPGRLLERKRVFYLRVDGLTEETLAGAKDELLQSLSASPSAMILDLRNSDSGESDGQFAMAFRFFELLTDEAKIAEWYGPRPLAVLISGKTSGAVALLASLLATGREKAVTMGSSTSGSCFPSISGEACGIRWKIPWIPAELAGSDIPTGKLDPVFPFSGASGQIDFRKLADPQAVSADTVLRAALDLTLSLDVLKKPEKPEPK